MKYKAKTSFYDGVLHMIEHGQIVELSPAVADQFVKLKYLEIYVEKKPKIRPAPLPEAETRITKVVMPEETKPAPIAEKIASVVTRRRGRPAKRK